MGHFYFFTSWNALFVLCPCMPLGEHILDTSLVNKSSELQGHLINPLCFPLKGFVKDVVRGSDSRQITRTVPQAELPCNCEI